MSPEGGYYVAPEILARLGGGDVSVGRKALRAILDIEAAHAPIMGPTEKPASVRAAVQADEPAILDMIRLDIAENARHIAPLDEESAMAQIHVATREGKATVGVIDAPDGLAGMVCLTPYRWWWSKAWFLQEVFLYVAPQHRNSRHVADLVKFSRWVSDDLSARCGYRIFLLSGVTATRAARAKIAIYRRLSNYIGIFCAYPDPTIH